MLPITLTANRIRRLVELNFPRARSSNFIGLDQRQSLEILINSGKSLIRFGDGEATLLEGGDVYFQRNSQSLRRELASILKTYSEQSPYLVAIPHQQISGHKVQPIWRKSQYIFHTHIGRDSRPIVLDAMMFREDTELNNHEIDRLWRSSSRIVFVHSNFKYFRDFASQYGIGRVEYVQVPSASSYAVVDQVIASVRNVASRDPLASVVLISAGPAGKIIAERCSRDGIRALDMGHYFDFKYYNLARG